MKANEKIRRAARSADVPQWKIASELGISEATFTRWLRRTLSSDLEKRIMGIIGKLSLERQEVG